MFGPSRGEGPAISRTSPVAGLKYMCRTGPENGRTSYARPDCTVSPTATIQSDRLSIFPPPRELAARCQTNRVAPARKMKSGLILAPPAEPCRFDPARGPTRTTRHDLLVRELAVIRFCSIQPARSRQKACARNVVMSEPACPHAGPNFRAGVSSRRTGLGTARLGNSPGAKLGHCTCAQKIAPGERSFTGGARVREGTGFSAATPQH